MTTFFHGWRRKAGCVTLVMACVFTVGWVRSWTIEDVFEFSFSRQPQVVVSSCSKIEWLWFLDYATHSIEPSPNLPAFWWPSSAYRRTAGFDALSEIRWQIKWYGEYDSKNGLKLQRRTVEYSYVVIPLTVLSAYLLLSKPRPPKTVPAKSTR